MGLLVIASAVFVLSWWLTRRFCEPRSRLYLLDHPNERSLHRVPTPRTGGVAVLVSAAIGFSLAVLADRWNQESAASLLISTGFWIIGDAAVLAAVSFYDDRRNLPISLRLGVQVVAALVLVVGADVALRSVWVPFFGHLDLGWAAWPITVVFLVWMTNLYNFMDGMDGFAGGMTLVGFGFLAYFAWQVAHPFVFTLSLMVATAAAGFLLSNFPPARIFMGDVGSVPIGFLAGALTLLGQREGLFDVWVPVMVFSPFILDATATVLWRALRGERVWEAHRVHYYQRLVLSGWGHRRTVLAEYALMVCCGIGAWLYHHGGSSGRTIIIFCWLAVFCALGAGVGVVEQRWVRQEVER